MAKSSTLRWSALPIVGVLGLGALAVGSGEARAGVDDITFDAVTSAYGVEFRLTNPSIPTGIAIEGSGPTTQAKLNSLPQGTSFASFPYPGEVGATINGPVRALTGLPVPDYPLYVAANSSNEAPEVGHYPGVDLTARVTDNLSESKATAFTDSAGYVAQSSVSQGKEGDVIAISKATQNGLRIGGILTLSNVLSTAEVRLDAFGKLTKSSSLTVGKFNAPALSLTLPDSFQPPNSAPIPNPFKGQVLTSPDLSYSDGNFFVAIPGTGSQKYPVPESAVVDAFKALGIDLSIQQAVVTDTAITAPTLVIKSVLPAPPANQVYNGETPVSFTIGRTSAGIIGSYTPASTDLGLAGDGASGGVGALPGADVSPGPVDAAGLGELPAIGALPGSVPTVDLAPAGGGSNQFVAARNGLELPGIAPFYFVLVIVAVLGLLGGQVLGYLGVRSAWKS
ncbi:hypothetical protein GCM10009547_12860 [Sporichthya brevicatena]|uniref:Uncharacterized protein n=1 Tax=Sporichthya brevicatena TaxID=171442 RepID=A0ABN1GIJ8_9ACTN